MKKLTILFALLVSVSALNAQDIITQRDGTDIQAKVTEVGISQISYKKYSNLDGPTYIIGKNDILMITYENGEREMYNTTQNGSQLPHGMITYNSWSGKFSVGGVTVSDRDLQLYLSADDYKTLRKGRIIGYTGGIVGVIGAIPLGWCLGELLATGSTNTAVLVASGVATVGGLVTSAIGESICKKAVFNYNASLAVMPAVIPTVDFGMPGSFDMNLGLALVLSF